MHDKSLSFAVQLSGEKQKLMSIPHSYVLCVCVCVCMTRCVCVCVFSSTRVRLCEDI